MSTQERNDGPTPSGGAYSVAYWQDEQGAPCEKDKAVACEVVEYDAKDKAIARIYAKLTSSSPYHA